MGKSVGCVPPQQPWKATCDLSADASHQALVRVSHGTAAAMRARITGPLIDDHRQLKTSHSVTFLNFAFSPVLCLFSESSIKTVLNQSAKNRDFFRQRTQSPHKKESNIGARGV